MRRYLLAATTVLLVLPTFAELEPRRLGPAIPTRVGSVNAIHDFWFEVGHQNENAATDLASLGFRTIKFWPTSSVTDSDVRAVIENPAFDVIVIRPLSPADLITETGCDGKSHQYYRWESPDYGEVAQALFETYGHLQKIIILTGWEADNQIKGLGCKNRVPSAAEVDFMRSLLDSRQAGVRSARTLYADQSLQVYHSVEVNHVLNTTFRVIDEIVPFLTNPPDLISFSAWSTDLQSVSMTDALNHIAAVTGKQRYHIFIGEYGRTEILNPDGSVNRNVHNAIYTRFKEAFDWGVSLGFYWNYRDQFACPKLDGNWIRRCDFSLSTAYGALWQLQSEYED